MMTKLTAVLLVVLIATGASASCSAPDSGTTFADQPSQWILSDADGTSSRNRSMAGETCFWRVTCSKKLSVWIEHQIGLNKLSILKNTAGASVPNAQTMEELYSFTHHGYASEIGIPQFFFYVDASDIFISYTTTEVANGFKIGASCQDAPNCTAKASVSGGVTTITTNPVGAAGLVSSDTCQFKVNCPSAALVQYTVDKAILYSISNIGSYDLLSSGLVGSGEFVVASPALLRISSVRAGGSATLSYTCRSSSCSSPTATGVKGLPSCTSPGGIGCPVTTLGMDQNGDGSGGYLLGEYCSWNLQCPAGQFLWIASSADYRNYVWVHQSPGPNGENWKRREIGSMSYFSVGNTAQMALSARKSPATGNLSAQVRCSPSRCDASEVTRTAASDTIYFGGASDRWYSNWAQCSFEIRCPAGKTSFEMECAGRKDGSVTIEFDELQLVNGSVEVAREAFEVINGSFPNLFSHQFSAASSWGMYRIRFKSGFSSGWSQEPGVRCTYTCSSCALVTVFMVLVMTVAMSLL